MQPRLNDNQTNNSLFKD